VTFRQVRYELACYELLGRLQQRRRRKWQENEITFVSCKYVSSELSWFLKESVFHYNGKAIPLL
jgi:hypothetical protein